MPRFEPLPPVIPEIYRHLASYPDSGAAALVRLVEAQDETRKSDVIGHLIAASDGDLRGPAAPLLHWLVEQPLELANAIRLFWILFQPDVYLGKQAAINNVVLGGPDRLALLCRLSDRIEAGTYPRGPLGVSARQSKLLKIALVQQTQEARFRGWDQLKDAAFPIPEVCLMPLTGKMLGKVKLGQLTAIPHHTPLSAAQTEAVRWAESHLRQAVTADQDLPEATDELALMRRNNRRVSVAMCVVLGLASFGALQIMGSGASSTPVQIADARSR